MADNNQQSFMKGPGGRIVVTAGSAVVIWGLMIGLLYSNLEPLALPVAAVCIYFGWKALTRIQPAMFLSMSWMGWLLYFFIKTLLSAAIGLFVAPFIIGKKVGGSIHKTINEMQTTTPQEAYYE